MELLKIKSLGGRKHNFIERPLLRWAGGKRRLRTQILSIFPSEFKSYHEPFIGGGAIFFSLAPKIGFISDLNEELINLYKVIRDNPRELYNSLRGQEISEDAYYQMRSYNPRTPLNKAKRFLYLNKTCFNGLYRVNKSGKFNVPYGHRTNIDFGSLEHFLSLSCILQECTIDTSDFEVVRSAEQGDLVYFDPPYTVMHNENGFIEYNKKIFSWEDQIRLKNLVVELTEKGVMVVVSNAHHESIADLYNEFKIHEVYRSSTISGRNESRSSKVAEFLITNYEVENE